MRLKEIERITVIHCDTRDKVAEIFKTVKESDYSIDIWDRYKENTCVRVCEGVVVGYDQIDYYIKNGYKITEFSDLIIPELSAKEVLETIGEICSLHHSCEFDNCPLYLNHKSNLCQNKMLLAESEKVIDICTKWREEHPKEEKKELETEWMYVVRIIKVHDNGKKECVHEVVYEINLDFEKACESVLKDYCSEHEGNFFATLEHICRIKE